jgi:hypothetical protein
MTDKAILRARAKAKADATLKLQATTPAPPPRYETVSPNTGNVVPGGYDRGSPSEVSNSTHFRAGMAQPKDQIKRYAAAMGRPEAEFGWIEGEIVHWDGSKYRKVVPDVVGTPMQMLNRVKNNISASFAKAAPSVAGGISGLVTTSPVAAGATAGIVNAGVQAADKALAGEDLVTTDYNVGSLIGDTALNAGGQLAGNAIMKMFTRNPAGVMPFDIMAAKDPALFNSAQALQQMAQTEFNITLSLGQATRLKSILGRERQAGRWPETTDDVTDFIRTQNETQVPDAIHSAIRGLSPKGGEEAVAAFRSGADDVVEAGLKERSAEASAAYKLAYDANKDMASPLLSRILKTTHGKQALEMARVEMDDKMKLMGVPDAELTQQMRVLADIGRMDRVSPGVSQGLKLETWDLVKRKLYDIEQTMINQVTGKPTSAGGAVKRLRQKLTAELDKLDKSKIAGPNSTYPGPGAYQKARMAYGDASETVEIILKGGPGILQRMKGLDHQRIVHGIFNEQRLTPEEMLRTKQAYLATGNAEAWNAGVARWLDDVLSKSMKPTQGGEGNVAGRFYGNVYGTTNQKDMLRVALGENDFPAFDRLLEVLDHARRSLPEGSPTATDLGAANAPDAIGELGRRAGEALSTDTYLNLGRKAAALLTEIRQPEARRKLVEVMLQPENVKELRKLRMVRPGTEKAFKVAADALVKLGVIGGVDAIAGPGETQAAPAAKRRVLPLLPTAPASR